MARKMNHKRVKISALCGLLGASVILAPTALFVSNCAPLQNTISFNSHDRSLAYMKSMTLSATCTFGDNVTLSASGTGKNFN